MVRAKFVKAPPCSIPHNVNSINKRLCAMSKLDSLKKMTAIVADTGDLKSITNTRPLDATTNPSLLLKAAKSGVYNHLLEKASIGENNQRRSPSTAAEIFAVLIGAEIADIVPGRVSTEVDARLSFDTHAMVETATRLIELYEQHGVDRSRVLIKIAATWEGIRAAEQLEKQNIQCNLTLLFNMAQARACAEAGVYLISPFVGRIYDYYKLADPGRKFTPQNDPGVLSVKAIFEFYREHDFKTIVMGASFRTTEQVLALAGCDRLTVSPNLLQALNEEDGEVVQTLHVPTSKSAFDTPRLTESEFRFALCTDPMANTKLAEGIAQFCKDQIALETLLDNTLQQERHYA